MGLLSLCFPQTFKINSKLSPSARLDASFAKSGLAASETLGLPIRKQNMYCTSIAIKTLLILSGKAPNYLYVLWYWAKIKPPCQVDVAVLPQSSQQRYFEVLMRLGHSSSH